MTTPIVKAKKEDYIDMDIIKENELPQIEFDDEEESTVTSKPISRKVELHDIDLFADAIYQTALKLDKLVEQGTISKQTRDRLILEYEYSFFQQLVAISYD
jgi:hypothetical protein